MRLTVFTKMTLLLLFFGSFAIHQTATAQISKPPKTTLKGNDLFKDPDIVNIPYCDQVVSQLSKSLQLKADRSCQTQDACILCRERQSGQPLYMTMFFQPDPEACSSTCVRTMAVEDTERRTLPGGEVNVPPFQAEIIQSTCVNGGNTLDVYIVGNSINRELQKDAYTYLWTVDGNKAGHGNRVDCQCGSEAVVRITHKSSGKSISKLVKLRPCTTNE